MTEEIFEVGTECVAVYNFRGVLPQVSAYIAHAHDG